QRYRTIVSVRDHEPGFVEPLRGEAADPGPGLKEGAVGAAFEIAPDCRQGRQVVDRSDLDGSSCGQWPTACFSPASEPSSRDATGPLVITGLVKPKTSSANKAPAPRTWACA